MIKSKIILTTTSSFAKESPELFNFIKKKGFTVVLNPFERKLNEEELYDLLEKNRPVGLLAGTELISEKILKKADTYLRVISRIGVGWDNVDRETASHLGILVYRTSGVLSNSVAELTVGFIIAALRNICQNNCLMHEKKWYKSMGNLLCEKVVGIIGFGSIGKQVGKIIHAFGARIVYHDLKQDNTQWATFLSLSELLKQSDIITIHASGHKTLLNKEELEKCKQGVILINTARGGLIDEEILYQRLSDGKIGFACLDVFKKEPYEGDLASLDNVILTPHIGSYAKEARVAMEKMAVENLFIGFNKLGIS